MDLLRKLMADNSHLELSADEVESALTTNTHVLLDVREQDEWDEAHIDGAILIPGSQLHQRIGELSTEKPVITMCHVGQRSLFALNILERAGHEGAKSMAGGIDAWIRSGKRVVR